MATAAPVALVNAHREHAAFDRRVGLVQGRGIGSALLTRVLQRADHAGVPCYLDATSPRNRRLYERHGFVARPAFAVAGGPPIWPMWRYPTR